MLKLTPKKKKKKKTLVKFLAPGPNKAMKVKKNKEKFGLKMDHTHTQPLSILFFEQLGGQSIRFP
jgi:hypothetical protein